MFSIRNLNIFLMSNSFLFAVRMVFYKIFVYIFSEKVRKVKTSIFIVETTVDDIKKPSF